MAGHGPHHHDQSGYGRAFGWSIGLNLLFVGVEAAYGLVAHSTALLADAGHNFSDVLGLIIAWIAVILGRRPPSPRYTYGLRSASILAALTNALLLLGACAAIAFEAIRHLISPQPVAGLTVSVVAAIGIVINGLSALMLMRGQANDINIRGAYLHMVADAAVSLGVMLAGIGMWWLQGWFWLDGAISLIIVAVILWGTWSLLRESLQLAMGAVPAHLELADIHAFLAEQPGVTGLHDLHVWGMSTTDTALTAHLVMPEGYPPSGFLDQLSERVFQRFGIQHCTFQIELAHREDHCALLDPARQTKPDFHGHSHGHAHSHADNHSDKRLSNHSDKHLANHSDKHLDNHLASQSHPHSHTHPRPHPHANDHEDHTH